MTSVETEVRELAHFIGGEWVSDGGTFEDSRPVHRRDRRERRGRDARRGGRRRLRRPRRPRPAGRQTVPAERQRIFLAAADILESRRDEVVSWLARETGCTFGFGMFQMGFVPGLFRQAAALAYAPLGTVIPSDHPGTVAMGIRRPVGRRRRDRALERGADPLCALDRGAAGPREHRRPEAVRVVAVLGRPALGRDLRRGRAFPRAC